MIAEPIYLDLDGTLVDSVPGIEYSLRHALEAADVAATVADWRPFIGPPVRQVVAAALPGLDGGAVDRVVAHFRGHYDAGGCERSVPWEAVGETLHALHGRGHPLFVVTNKPILPTRRILAANGWTELFRGVVAGDEPYRPAPGQVLIKADRAEILAREERLTGGLFVGDGPDDAEAAIRVGARFLLARWGYGVANVRQAFAGVSELAAFRDILSVDGNRSLPGA